MGFIQIRNLDKAFGIEVPDIQAVGGDQNSSGPISALVVFELVGCPYIFCGSKTGLMVLVKPGPGGGKIVFGAHNDSKS